MTQGLEANSRSRSRRLRAPDAGRASRYANYRPGLLRALCTIFLRIAFKVTMRLTIDGLEHFPRQGACIVMINHVAFLDPVIVSGRFPRPVISMAKVQALEHWFTGPLIRIFGAFPVNRGDVDRKALKTAFEVLDNGLPLLIAPEGTRSQDASLGEPHLGLAYIAAQSAAPIVPVAISGSHLWKHNIVRLRRTSIRVRVGQPFRLDPGGQRLTSDRLQRMTDEAMYQLAACLPAAQRGRYGRLDAATTEFVRLEMGGAGPGSF